MRQNSPAGRSGVPGASSFLGVRGVFVLQILLLAIGINRDYQLKHEDNNALHATFARSHLRLGLETTRGQNYFYSPATHTGAFYPNHPAGPGLVLAVFYGLTGSDGPVLTRAVAMGFHVLGSWLFYRLACRLLEQRWRAVLALLLYVVVPESSFFGRMLNHEVLVLPAAILLVRGYWEAIHGDWARPRWMTAIVIAAVWATIAGWAGFFVIGACALHAAWEAFFRRNHRATPALIALVVVGPVLFAATIAHLLWVLGGDVAYLGTLLTSRMGAGEGAGLGQWLGRILELHWRYFGLTSGVGLGAIVYRAVRQRRGDVLDPAQEVGLLFLLAGAGYVAVFNASASRHDYWQFMLLPASALGIVLLLQRLSAATVLVGRRSVRRALIAVVIFDISLVTTVTSIQRHGKQEAYCLRVVEELRRDRL